MPEMPQQPSYAEVQPADDERLTDRQEQINRERRALQDSIFIGQVAPSLQNSQCTPEEWSEVVRAYTYEPVPTSEQKTTEQWRTDVTQFIAAKKQAQGVLTLLQLMTKDRLQEYVFPDGKKVTLQEVQETAKRQLAQFVTAQNKLMNVYAPSSQSVELPSYLAEYVPLSTEMKRLATMTEAMLVTQFDVRDAVQLNERHDMVLNEANEILQVVLHKNLRVSDIVNNCIDSSGNIITTDTVYKQLLEQWNIASQQSSISQEEQINALKMIVGFLHKNKPALEQYAKTKPEGNWLKLRLHTALESATKYSMLQELHGSFAEATHDMIEGDYVHALDSVLDEVKEPVPSEIIDALLFDNFRKDPFFKDLSDEQLREKVHTVYLELSTDGRSVVNILRELQLTDARVVDTYKKQIITTIIHSVASTNNVQILRNSLLIPANSEKQHHKQANEIWENLLSEDSDTLRGKDVAQLYFSFNSVQSPDGKNAPNLVLGLQAINLLAIERQNADIARQIKMDVLNRMYATMKHALFSIIYRSDPIEAIEEEVSKLDLTEAQKTELLNTYKYLIQKTQDEVNENYKNFRDLPLEIQAYILWPYLLGALGSMSLVGVFLRMKANRDYEKGRKMARELSNDVQVLSDSKAKLDRTEISSDVHAQTVQGICNKWKMSEQQLLSTERSMRTLVQEHQNANKWYNVFERHADRKKMNQVRNAVNTMTSEADESNPQAPEINEASRVLDEIALQIETLLSESDIDSLITKINDVSLDATTRLASLESIQKQGGLVLEESELAQIRTAIETNQPVDVYLEQGADVTTPSKLRLRK